MAKKVVIVMDDDGMVYLDDDIKKVWIDINKVKDVQVKDINEED